MKRLQTLTLTLIVCGSLALLASGAAAEWLVTSDGSRIEIDGPYTVEGKLVTFSLLNGTLGSMPLTAVDLEATKALAEKIAEPPVLEEPVKRKAIMVITDADVGHPRLPAASPVPAGDDADAEEVEAPALRVTGWREEVDSSRTTVAISGTLQNPTQNPATSIALDVQLYDAQGGLLETSSARLERGFLNPGGSVRFDASFDETLSYDRVEFHIQSRGFLSEPPPDEDSSDGDDEAEDEEQS